MLQRVSIQNFKSLKDVTLDLQKVNLLIGPNNSGKTNFLKAITSFADDTAIDSKAFRRGNSELVFEIAYEFEEGSKYLVNLPSSRLSYKKIFTKRTSDESVTIDHPHKLFFLTGPENSKNLYGGETPFFREVYQYLQVPIYKINPDSIIHTSQYRSDAKLNEDGSNLLQLLQYLDSRTPFEFEKLEGDFNHITKEFVKIRRPDTQPGMFELLLVDKFGVGYRKEQLSEGVLYFLALLCVIYQPDPPKLLLLEEPEKGIHPRRIHDIINFIFRLVDDKDIQVIMTTHSPVVVDEFKDLPESVFIFDKDEEGATHVKNLQKDIIEPESELSRQHNIDPPQYLNGLGEAWKVGFLGGVPR